MAEDWFLEADPECLFLSHIAFLADFSPQQLYWLGSPKVFWPLECSSHLLNHAGGSGTKKMPKLRLSEKEYNTMTRIQHIRLKNIMLGGNFISNVVGVYVAGYS